MASMDPEEIYAPRDVAERLDLSGAALRRIAVVYEDLYGPLRRDPPGKHGKRVWTGEAVERLEHARALVHTGHAGSIEDALRAGDGGEDVDSDYPVHRKPARADIAAIVDELRAMRLALKEYNALLAAIERQAQL